MRRHDKEIKDPEILEEILLKSEVCRLGLTDKGMAYIVPVNFAYQDGIIYFHSAPSGRKMRLLKEKSQISFEMELSAEIIRDPVACNWTTKYHSLTGTATASILTDTKSKKRGMDLIMRKYGAAIDLHYDAKTLSRMVMVALTVESVTGKQSGDW